MYSIMLCFRSREHNNMNCNNNKKMILRLFIFKFQNILDSKKKER